MRTGPNSNAMKPGPSEGWTSLVVDDPPAVPAGVFSLRHGLLNIVLLTAVTSALAAMLGLWMENGMLVAALGLSVAYALVIGTRAVALIAAVCVMAILLAFRFQFEPAPAYRDSGAALLAVNILSVLVVLLLAAAVEQRRQAAQHIRQTAARTARQSELTRTFIDGLGPSVFVALLDEQGRTVDVKHGAFGTAGQAPRERLGRHFADLDWWASAETRRRIERALDTARDGGTDRFDVLAHCDDGDRWLDCSTAPMTDGHGAHRYIVVSAVSIDARKRAEERLVTVVESVPTALLMVDRAGCICFVNAPAENLFGYRREELIGAPLAKLLPESARAGHERMMQQYLRNPQQRLMGAGRELFAVHADGHEVPVEIGLSPVRNGADNMVLAAVSDVSERQAAHRALQAFATDLEHKVAERTSALEASNERWKRRNEGLLLVNELSGLQSACTTEEELCAVTGEYQARLFPGSCGAIFLGDQEGLARFAQWGQDFEAPDAIATDSCWAMRRIRLHCVGPDAGEMRCDHLQRPLESGGRAICMPLGAKGEGIGMLHVVLPAALVPHEDSVDDAKLLLRAIGGHLALSLANMRLHGALRRQAVRDPLTGLHNRRSLAEHARRLLSRAARESRDCAVMVGDLDHFKRLNDQHGHAFGDDVLRSVADAINRQLRAEDIACRHGGEEFVVLLGNATGDSARRLAERIRASVESLQMTNGPSVTISLGVAIYPKHGERLETLLQAADGALYRAKAEGRNRVCFAQAKPGTNVTALR